MFPWNGRLRRLIMTAPDPAQAAQGWASVLSGRARDQVVELGDDTQIVVVDGPEHGLVEMQFDASDALMETAERAGAEPEGDGLLVHDPDGWAVRLVPVSDVSPLHVKHATLSHCTLLSPDPMGQCAYWQGVGLRLSETIGEVFGWLRPNPVHHTLSFTAAREVGIQHLAVELPDAGSLIAAIDALVGDGGQVEFGPGRHIVGGNLFAYVLEQTGIRWELCAELQRLPADAPTRHHPEEMRVRSINCYGPRPPASFVERPGGPGPIRLDRAQSR